MADEIAEDVRRFLLEKIDSVEQLEVLLMVRADPAASWDADTVGKALYTTPASAEKRLADLKALGLLDAGEGHYRYAAGSAERDRLLDGVAAAYRERRVAVIGLIYSKPPDQVQAFADAFKLRKEG